MEENWVDKVSKEIDDQIDLCISVRDYRFYQIEKLKRIARHLHKQENCLECKSAKKELENIVLDLDRLINKSGVNRGEYEKRVEKLIKHLKDHHNIFQAHHFTYSYSAIFTLAGAGFGILLSYGVYSGFIPFVFFMSAGVAMFIGNVFGSRKDKRCVREGKQI